MLIHSSLLLSLLLFLSLSLCVYSIFFLLHTAAEEVDVFEEPPVLTPGTQSAQFAERFDRWLQNLRQQQLRLFSSCTSRIDNVDNDAPAIQPSSPSDPAEPDSKLDFQPEPESAEPEPEAESPEPEAETKAKLEAESEPVTDTEAEAATDVSKNYWFVPNFV